MMLSHYVNPEEHELKTVILSFPQIAGLKDGSTIISGFMRLLKGQDVGQLVIGNNFAMSVVDDVAKKNPDAAKELADTLEDIRLQIKVSGDDAAWDITVKRPINPNAPHRTTLASLHSPTPHLGAGQG